MQSDLNTPIIPYYWDRSTSVWFSFFFWLWLSKKAKIPTKESKCYICFCPKLAFFSANPKVSKIHHPTSNKYTNQAQVFDRLITRSRAKKLQQEVNVLLYEIYFNINENYILAKSCMLLLLRFTMEDDINTKKDYREGPHSNPTSPAEQSERNSHNFWFPKPIKVNEDIFVLPYPIVH